MKMKLTNMKMSMTSMLVLSLLFGSILCVEVIQSPDKNNQFITGRGCGISNTIKYINHVPENLEDFACTFVQMENSVPIANIKTVHK